ncbi:CBS domain-containing protein [Saccharicrinis carchari]|uniref:CBS domain-containing protein n=1 Tax=Saccharicrinis carchari TaxID=1168039 RepID=A0A521CGB4_SACCC|nr:CBS domain-containing protein [Saccharicrinis carchari]SMO58442.1 CBS domain-containing protein [Saccharicrinis carchari]
MDTDKVLLEQYVCSHPKEAVRDIERLKDDEKAVVLAELPHELSLSVLSIMNRYLAAKSIERMNLDLAIALFDKMEITPAESILRRCDPQLANKIMDAIAPPKASLIRQKLKVKEDTVASFMNPIVFALKKHRRAEEALRLIKQVKKGVSTFVCVVDEHDNYVGIVMLHELLFADSSTKIAAIIKTDSPCFSADTDIESLSKNTVWQQYRSVPVIDSNGKLVGMLDFKTVDKNTRDPQMELTQQIIETSNSLGELYSIGLSGFLHVIGK